MATLAFLSYGGGFRMLIGKLEDMRLEPEENSPRHNIECNQASRSLAKHAYWPIVNCVIVGTYISSSFSVRRAVVKVAI